MVEQKSTNHINHERWHLKKKARCLRKVYIVKIVLWVIFSLFVSNKFSLIPADVCSAAFSFSEHTLTNELNNEIGKLSHEKDETELHTLQLAIDDTEEALVEVDDTFLYQEIQDCNEAQKNDAYLTLVSTIDGQLTALDAENGNIIWSFNTSHKETGLIFSSLPNLEVTAQGEWVRLIPSLDGRIYQFNGDTIEPLPVSVDRLLQTSVVFNKDTSFTGMKEVESLGVLASTGYIVYVCNHKGCRQKQMVDKSSAVIVIKKTIQSVCAFDPKTGVEKWNYSVAQNYLSVVGGGCNSLLEEGFVFPKLEFVVPEGVISAVDEDDQLVWQRKFASPVVGAWKFYHNTIEEVDLLSMQHVPALAPGSRAEMDEEDAVGPLLYVGFHHNQLYLQESKKMKDQLMMQSFGISPPKIEWQPYLASSPFLTPAAQHGSERHPLLLDYHKDDQTDGASLMLVSSSDSSFEKGYYLYGDSSVNFTEFWAQLPFVDDRTDHGGESIFEEVSSKISKICFEVGTQFWLMIFSIVLCYILVHFTLFHFIVRNEQQYQMGMALRMVELILRHNAAANFFQRLVVRHPQILPPNRPTDMDDPSVPSSRQSSEDVKRQYSSSSESEYQSRFLKEFEPIKMLGKGAFGIVYHAKNKLDESDYAVKRITIPQKKSAAERMKQEVRALARLNHMHIVRYYSSWLETCPANKPAHQHSCWDNKNFLSGSFPYNSEEPTSSDMSYSKVHQPASALSGVIGKLMPKMLESANVSSGWVSSPEYSSYQQSGDSSLHDKNTVKKTRQSRLDSCEIIFDNCQSVRSTCEEELSDGCVQKRSSFSIIFENSESDPSPVLKDEVETSSLSIVFEPPSNQGVVVPPGTGDSVKKASPDATTESASVKSQVAVELSTFLYIQMELCRKETLNDWLRQGQHTLEDVLFIFNSIVKAVEYIHDQHLIHRDLKPSNIFFSLDGIVKIGDLGLVTTADEDDLYQSSRAGTYLYMSPEQMRGLKYNYKVDIFSLGIIFFEMLWPFSTEMERRETLLQVRQLKFPEGFETKFCTECDLLRVMLSEDPEERPTTGGLRARSPLCEIQGDDIKLSQPEDCLLLNSSGGIRSHAV